MEEDLGLEAFKGTSAASGESTYSSNGGEASSSSYTNNNAYSKGQQGTSSSSSSAGASRQPKQEQVRESVLVKVVREANGITPGRYKNKAGAVRHLEVFQWGPYRQVCVCVCVCV
jgi:hypothetical protein